MKYVLILFVVLILLIPTLAASAQDNDLPEGWPIIERCIDGPTRRPDGWTFEGTILLTDYTGIHAVNDAWSTPRVVAFTGSTMPGGAELSPDGQWYAVLNGQLDTEGQPSPSRTWHINEIRIYSTSDNPMIRLPRSYEIEYGISSKTQVQIRWWDNEHIIFTENRYLIYARDTNPVIINIFTNETIAWEGQINPIQNQYDLRLSPDWSRALMNTDEVPIDPDNWGMYDPMSGDLLQKLALAESPTIRWMPDSSHFAAEIQSDEMTTRQLALFDREGNLIDTILDVTNLTRTVWSKDNRYLALIEHKNLYIVDTDTRQIMNTCITTDSALAWSPDNTQLTFMANGYDQRPIYVFDIVQNQIYTVAYHSGTIIGWRE